MTSKFPVSRPSANRAAASAGRGPIEAQGEGLADADIGERLRGLVHRDPEQTGRGCVLYDDLVPERLPDRLHLRQRHGAKLDPGAPGAKSRRPHGRFRTDEELVTIEVRTVLDEVVGVPLALERRAARVALELERPRADDVRL